MMDCKNFKRKQDDISNKLQTIANSVFKKTFTITGNANYDLPKPDFLFKGESWRIDKLQNMKEELNLVKSKLNNYCIDVWHEHTSFRNSAKYVERTIRKYFQPEFVTQAWCKFHEIISKYPLIPKEAIFANNSSFVSLHLCEAPGAFITCLNHWLKTNLPIVHWDWLAISYNPYYEGNSNSFMINDDRFMINTLKNWFFGKDNTGNLMNLENLDSLIETVKHKGKVYLVTADGSINCTTNPCEQEGIVAGLHYCEVVAALHILETGGNLLLKMFTTFECQSICLIYFLSCTFNIIHFYKPVTSKEGNSEVYVICLGFKGYNFILPYLSILRNNYGKSSDTVMFSKDDIPTSFIDQIIACSQVFKNYQCEVIENNIASYHSGNDKKNMNSEIEKIAKLVVDKFLIEFPLQKLHIDLQIIGNHKIIKFNNYHGILKTKTESFTDRQKIQNLEPVKQLLLYLEQVKSLSLEARTFTFKAPLSCLDICIKVGKPYRRIQSSRFCSIPVAESFSIFFQAIDNEKSIQLSLPIEDNIIEYESSMKQTWNDTYKILYFEYTEISNHVDIITKIKDILISMRIGDNLVFFGYLLLTQFNVGLVYLLAQTFANVQFVLNEKIGYSIVFNRFRSKESVIDKINQVYATANDAFKHNATVLSIISVINLCASELHSTINDVNNWTIKYFINYIASIYNES